MDRLIESAASKCAEDLGASDILAATRVQSGDSAGHDQAIAELEQVKDYLASKGFPSSMIFLSPYFSQETKGVNKVFIQLSCRYKK